MSRLLTVTAGRIAIVLLLPLWGCESWVTAPTAPDLDQGLSQSLVGMESGTTLDAPVHVFESPLPQGDAQFGSAVAAMGDNVLVGVPLEDAGGTGGAGRAYLFSTDGTQLASFEAPDPAANARFGWSVAAAGEKVIVGANTRDVEGTSSAGQAYLFASDGTHLHTFRSPDPQSSAQFGRSVAAVGENVLVGAHRESVDGVFRAGRAYLFASDGTLLQTFQAPEPQREAEFGIAVGAVGETIIVGAWNETVNGVAGAGRAYLFNSDGTHLATLQSPAPGGNDRLGMSVAAVNGHVLVGAPVATVDGQFAAGQAHLFATDGTHVGTFQSPEPQGAAQFGFSVRGAGENLLVSANRHDIGGASNAGQTYLFAPDGTHLQTFQSPELAAGHTGFGTSVTALGQRVVVGAATHDVGEDANAGRAYLFDLPSDFVEPEGPGGSDGPDGAGGPSEPGPGPCQITGELIDGVDALHVAGRLNPGQARALTATLEAACASIENERTPAACNQLGAFIAQVEAMRRSGYLTDEEADGLIAEAELAREELCEGPGGRSVPGARGGLPGDGESGGTPRSIR